MHKAKLLEMLKAYPRAVTDSITEDLFFMICEVIDSPRSLSCWILFENREYAQLVSLEIDPKNYSEPKRFSDDYLVTKFLSKYPGFTHVDLRPATVAIKAFHDFETQCRETNQKFRRLELDPSLWDPSMRAIFGIARRKISSLLRTPDLASISLGFGWGPGATSSTSGSYTSAYAKFGNRLDVTSNALLMGLCCINSTPAWANCQLQTDEFPSVEASVLPSAFNVIRGNKIVFVPKNAKTHRVIAIEPHVNSYLQKGFGSEMRKLMRVWWNLDLNDQGINQRLAQKGSLTGLLATIDLKGASDTISSELVRLLLPGKWFRLLDMARSKQGSLSGTWVHYEKFSSMGNGFTFELETLIFYALCKSCVEYHAIDGEVSCYGDDLIVPTAAYEHVVRVIDFAGFSVNGQKSYSSGPFRESCGKDYFNGHDVRPIFLKEEISNHLALTRTLNSLRRYAHKRMFYLACDARFFSAYTFLTGLLPRTFRDLRVPEGAGDVGVLSNFDEALPTLKRPSQAGWDGYLYRCLIQLPNQKLMKDRHAGYTASLSAAGSPEPALGFHTLRKSTYPKVTRSRTFVWYNLGPWR
jgi:hypothetical protein